MTFTPLEKMGIIEDEIIEPVDERWLCESQAIYLRPNQLYYFTVHPDCDRCKELNVYDDQP